MEKKKKDSHFSGNALEEGLLSEALEISDESSSDQSEKVTLLLFFQKLHTFWSPCKETARYEFCFHLIQPYTF